MGEDVNRKAGTRVCAIGEGKVIYSATHPGSDKKPNWGNIIIIAHKNPRTKKVFYSLCGHLGKRIARKNTRVHKGQVIGYVGKAFTADNGWWEPHLHFAIYTGSKPTTVLPGYWKPGQNRTKRNNWRKPSSFVNPHSDKTRPRKS